MMQNPNSLLCTFFGLHMVQPAGGNEMYFVVMNNTFTPEMTIHERYDLKVNFPEFSTNRVLVLGDTLRRKKRELTMSF